jgi:hypothetical protein
LESSSKNNEISILFSSIPIQEAILYENFNEHKRNKKGLKEWLPVLPVNETQNKLKTRIIFKIKSFYLIKNNRLKYYHSF